ncbi:hypothetical protein AX774_g3420 [Zancudomyces culisetae]|uniref:SPRY domain-containing protein n=1 Tax=Zancudomyces culisetae TaxID=1213189 RepID=A0A1R1PQD2_ZANCU|nr:hypothetical protein AX774_g3420 [Zancudomyces culisetae]|eukprot:OMH83082.1 hypothetical protein AX774_g3420 [Zancudomyces culisetae]
MRVLGSDEFRTVFTETRKGRSSEASSLIKKSKQLIGTTGLNSAQETATGIQESMVIKTIPAAGNGREKRDKEEERNAEDRANRSVSEWLKNLHLTMELTLLHLAVMALGNIVGVKEDCEEICILAQAINKAPFTPRGLELFLVKNIPLDNCSLHKTNKIVELLVDYCKVECEQKIEDLAAAQQKKTQESSPKPNTRVMIIKRGQSEGDYNKGLLGDLYYTASEDGENDGLEGSGFNQRTLVFNNVIDASVSDCLSTIKGPKKDNIYKRSMFSTEISAVMARSILLKRTISDKPLQTPELTRRCGLTVGNSQFRHVRDNLYDPLVFISSQSSVFNTSFEFVTITSQYPMYGPNVRSSGILDKVSFSVQLLTGGLMQVGFVTDKSVQYPISGKGVGDDDSESIAFDGFRKCRWYGISTYDEFGGRWHPGDIVTLTYHCVSNTVELLVNGVQHGIIFGAGAQNDSSGLFSYLPTPPENPRLWFPAISLSQYQGVKFLPWNYEYLLPSPSPSSIPVSILSSDSQYARFPIPTNTFASTLYGLDVGLDSDDQHHLSQPSFNSSSFESIRFAYPKLSVARHSTSPSFGSCPFVYSKIPFTNIYLSLLCLPTLPFCLPQTNHSDYDSDDNDNNNNKNNHNDYHDDSNPHDCDSSSVYLSWYLVICKADNIIDKLASSTCLDSTVPTVESSLHKDSRFSDITGKRIYNYLVDSHTKFMLHHNHNHNHSSFTATTTTAINGKGKEPVNSSDDVSFYPLDTNIQDTRDGTPGYSSPSTRSSPSLLSSPSPPPPNLINSSWLTFGYNPMNSQILFFIKDHLVCEVPNVHFEFEHSNTDKNSNSNDGHASRPSPTPPIHCVWNAFNVYNFESWYH